MRPLAASHLKDRKARGEHVNDRDLRKHKYDVFRLLRIADRSKTIPVTGLVKEYTERFLREIGEEDIPFAQLGLPLTMEEAMDSLEALYKME